MKVGQVRAASQSLPVSANCARAYLNRTYQFVLASASLAEWDA